MGLLGKKRLKRDEILTVDLDLLGQAVEWLYHDRGSSNGLGSTLKEWDAIRPKYLLQAMLAGPGANIIRYRSSGNQCTV
jgi:hypothetical protein